MLKTSIAGHDLVLGMDWFSSGQSHSTRGSAIREILKETDSTVGVVQTQGGEWRLGLTEAEFKGSHSAAALLAQAHKNVALIAPIDEESAIEEEQSYWYVLIVDGLVYPGSDRLGTPEELVDQLQQHREMLGSAADSLELITAEDGLIEECDFVPLDELFAETKPSRTTRIRDVSSALPKPAQYALLAGIIVIAAMWIYEPPEPAEDDWPDLEDLEPAEPEPEPEPEPEIEEEPELPAAEQRFREAVSLLSEHLAQSEPRNLLDQLTLVSAYFSDARGGYQAREIALSYGGEALVSLRQLPGGRIIDAAGNMPEGFEFSYSSNGEVGEAWRPAELTDPADEERLRQHLRDARGDHLTFATEINDFAKRFRVDHRFSSGYNIGTPEGQVSMVSILEFESGEDTGMRGFNWNLRFPMWAFDEVRSWLIRYPTAGITSVTYRPAVLSSGTPSVSLEGYYYERR